MFQKPTWGRLCTLALLTIACDKTTPAANSGPYAGALDSSTHSQVLARLDERSSRLTDFWYQGVVENTDANETLHFSFQFQQPGKLKATLDEAALTYVFDGTWLAIYEHHKKRLLKQDISAKDEGTRLAALHELFRQFSIDGWRAPLFRWKEGTLQISEMEADGERVWELRSALADEELAFVRYRFSVPFADFLRKDFIDKKGEIRSATTVLKSASGPRVGQRYPVEWEQRNGEGRYRVRLSAWRINEGLGADAFSVEAPAGYELRVIEAQ